MDALGYSIEIIAELIIERIKLEVWNSMFSVIVDETSDMSKTEQVSLCLSFDLLGVKKEVFVGFSSTKETDGPTSYN